MVLCPSMAAENVISLMRVTLIIRRMKCDSCSRIHHELPDCIVPYKQYSSAVIEALLSLKGDDIKEATFPGESSSMYRIISWFSLLRLYFEGVLNSLKLQWKDDLEIQKDLASLLPLVATSLPAGWLKMLVRYAVNSGFWLQTHFA